MRRAARARRLAFTSAELLLDGKLAVLLGEADRAEGVRPADAYLVVEEGATTRDAYLRCASAAAFFKQAACLDLIHTPGCASELQKFATLIHHTRH